MQPLRDPGAYIKHPERGPDVFVGRKQEPMRELSCNIDNKFSEEAEMAIQKSDHILFKARKENEMREKRAHLDERLQR